MKGVQKIGYDKKLAQLEPNCPQNQNDLNANRANDYHAVNRVNSKISLFSELHPPPPPEPPRIEHHHHHHKTDNYLTVNNTQMIQNERHQNYGMIKYDGSRNNQRSLKSN